MTPNTGFGTGTLSNFECMTEQQIQLGSGCAFRLGNIPRVANLTEDFGFTNNGGVDTRGNAEEMSGSRIGIVHVEVVGQFFRRSKRQFREEGAEIAIGRMKLFGDDIDLGAIAGRQHDGFAYVVVRQHIGQRLRQPSVIDRDSLEQSEWDRAVIQSNDDDRHAWRRSLASAR